MNRCNEIHKLHMKDFNRYRLLTNNECKDFINSFYNFYKENEHDIYFCDNEWINKTVFCYTEFGQQKYLQDIIRNKDFDELCHHTKLYCQFKGLCIKEFEKREIKFFYFMTATGKDRILESECTIGDMYKLNKKIFNNDCYKRFYKVYWNIETGKNSDNPNLHTHALIIFDKTNKNFDRDYKNLFRKAFGNIDLDLQKFGWRGNQEIYEDKLNYLKNKDKSILHKNYKDLEIFEYLE